MAKISKKNNSTMLICCISIIFILIVVAIALIILQNRKNEHFKNVPWAFEQGPEYQPYSTNPLTKQKQIVGSDPHENEITGWQYSDKNTLVDYHFYKENNDLSFYENSDIKNTNGEEINVMKRMDRIAPITNSDIGIIPNAQYEINGIV